MGFASAKSTFSAFGLHHHCTPKVDPLAQSVEHNTFNVGVLGSNPKRITRTTLREPIRFPFLVPDYQYFTNATN